jgi:hypothetical protein
MLRVRYCAPEIAAEKPRGRPSDILSLGCVFLEMATVLMAQDPLTLKSLRNAVVANGRKAYYANFGPVQQWILMLCTRIATDAWGYLQNDNGYMLEWCVAMLYPDPARRLSAQSLYRIIQDVDNRVLAQIRFLGTCCDAASVEEGYLEARPHLRLFKRWHTPAMARGDNKAKGGAMLLSSLVISSEKTWMLILSTK